MPDNATTTRSFWSGTISFGLVSIPVDLYPANRTAVLGMRMLGPDGQPLKRQYICSIEGKTVGQEELVRGYEVSEDEFVTVSDEELES